MLKSTKEIMLLRYTVQPGLILLDFFLCDFTVMHCGMDNPWLHLSASSTALAFLSIE